MPGPLGYPDWQRQTNWDGPVVFGNTALVCNPRQTAGLFDVSRFAYLGGYCFGLAGTCQLSVGWFADKLAAVQVGGRAFPIAASVPVQAQFRVPNLGPYVQVTWDTLGGPAATVSTEIFGTNRAHPLEFIPTSPQLITASNVALAANTATNVSPVDYYAGPMRVWFFTNAANWAAVLYRKGVNAPDQIVERQQTTGNTDLSFTTVAPPGAWYVSVQNNTAVGGNYYLSVTPTMTGST